MLTERDDQQHGVDEADSEDSSSQRLTLTRTLSSGVSATESIAYQGNAPEGNLSDNGKAAANAGSISWVPVQYLILMGGFLTSMSFGVTQVPLLYVFRLMTCDGYYKSHPDPTHGNDTRSVMGKYMIQFDEVQPVLSYLFKTVVEDNDRCSIHPIETSTALSIALLGATTTIFGIINLFLAGSLIKSIGVQRTLILQVFFPALRLLIQNVGVEVWGYTGILIIQCSQIVSLMGGPSGYILALNQFITDVVSSEQRTAALGRLTGVMLSGAAFGFLIGGILADKLGIKAPFRFTLALFLCSTAFVTLFLPYIPPSSKSVEATDAGGSTLNSQVKSTQRSRNKFFGPLFVFYPQKYVSKEGRVRREYGAFLLACGVFLGIVATGYLVTLLQLYSTDVFNFGTAKNGWLIFMYSMLRGMFLTFAFPQIIRIGRKYSVSRETGAQKSTPDQPNESPSSERHPLLGDRRAKSRETNDKSSQAGKQVFKFDLTYTRFSIVTDGILTLLCTFLREGWQMYLVAAILPFAAGTGSAAKGTVLQITGANTSEERTDALAGLSLVENTARLTTTFVFGVVFAGFTNLGRPELVFTVNAACALVAFCVLIFAHFPPEGSVRLDSVDKPIEEESPE